jgi:hypothetical protein
MESRYGSCEEGTWIGEFYMNSLEIASAPLAVWETPVLENLGSPHDVAGGNDFADEGGFATRDSS